MFILGNFLAAFAQVLDVVITLMYWLILIRALLSWVNPDPYNAIVILLNRVTEPVLAPFKRLIPTHSIGVDLSPLFAILALMFIDEFLVSSLKELAYRLH